MVVNRLQLFSENKFIKNKNLYPLGFCLFVGYKLTRIQSSGVDFDSGDGLDPLEVLGDPGESVRQSRLAAEAGHEAGNANGLVLASALLVVQGAARVTLKQKK